jgi:excisionase family DNA binding protein
MQNVHFSPPELAPLFGVNVSTIKRWVDRGLIASEVTPGGHRRISQIQLKQFLEKYPKYLRRSYVLSRLHQSHMELPAWKDYESALFERRDHDAKMILESALLRRVPIAKIFDDFIGPTLVSVGKKWAQGEATIYDEHRISFQIRTHIQHLDDLLPDPGPKSPVALLACVAGDNHELPLQMIGLVLKEAGWNPEITGINTPITALSDAIHHVRPQVVTLTCTFRSKGLDKYLEEARRLANSKKIRLLYGGGGWSVKAKREPGYVPTLQDLAKNLPLVKKLSSA